MLEISITLFIAFVTAFCIFDFFIRKRRVEMTADIPGPNSYPFFGNALMYFGKTEDYMMESMVKNRYKYGGLYRVWIFYQLVLFSANPKDIEVIFSSPKYITKNTLYDLLHIWLGNGLLMSTGQKWHQRRKIITPTFHFKILEEFVEIFDQQSAILVEKLKPLANEKEFDIHPYINLMALDVIAETAMGTKVNAQTDEDCEYVRAVHDITEIMSWRFLNVIFRKDWIFPIVAPMKKIRQSKALRTLHTFTEDIIEKRRAALEESLKNGAALNSKTDDDIGTKNKMALLDVLLQATVDGKPLSNADIREEVDTFMFEGHDTTTSGITFCLHLISRHPEVQGKLFTEIREVLGDDKNQPITYRELQDLKYVECVIKETLRLYPSVPIVGRLLTDDINLNGRIIPAGTNFTVGIFVMLRDPDLFPNPDKFIPERHLTENTTEKINPYAYIPFSAGPRNCIGQKFAMLEMKSTITKILRHYELLPLGPDVQPTINVVLRSKNGTHLGLKPRIY